MTDQEFLAHAIEQTQQRIDRNNYPCKIQRVSKVRQLSCEWCPNTTRSVFISFIKNPGAEDFTNGWCNNGGGEFCEDDSFYPQHDWYVCGKCPDS